ncbi:MAG: hypothetical protein L0207_00620 [Chlamydiae bacterium]|nr:hypothetical protein [Chlamydiota bacterium]
MSQDFSVEQGFTISLIFFLRLWPFIEKEVKFLPGDAPSTHELFFFEVCSGFESSAEWNEAVFRAKKISKEKQRQLKLSEEDLFLCTIEFCKLHNERYESRLGYTVDLLESMKQNPKNHKAEWTTWKSAIDAVINKNQRLSDFNWSAELP